MSSRIRTLSLQDVVAMSQQPVAGVSGIPRRRKSIFSPNANERTPRGRRGSSTDRLSQLPPLFERQDLPIKRNSSLPQFSPLKSRHDDIEDDDNLLICGNVLKFTLFVQCEEGTEMDEARRLFRYDIPEEQAAEGGFGKVYIAKKIPGDQKYAVKVYQIKNDKTIDEVKNQDGRDALIESMHEIMVLRAVKGHPNFVKMIEHFMINHWIYIVMEVEEDNMENQLALAYPNGMPEIKARRWFRQIVEAVGYMHQLGIVHNDIKPGNVMISRFKEQYNDMQAYRFWSVTIFT